MTWLLTLLAVHVLATVGFAVLYRSAPCWMQKLVVAGLVLAMVLFTVAYGLQLADEWYWVQVGMLGFVIEHLAVLLYVFRLIHQRLACPPTSSQFSPR